MFEPPTILVMESFDVEQEKKILRKSFNGKASLAAGLLHILCALVTVATYMYGEYVSALKCSELLKMKTMVNMVTDHGADVFPRCWYTLQSTQASGLPCSSSYLESLLLQVKNRQKKNVGEPSQFSFNPLVKSYPRSNWVDETDAENLSK